MSSVSVIKFITLSSMTPVIKTLTTQRNLYLQLKTARTYTCLSVRSSSEVLDQIKTSKRSFSLDPSQWAMQISQSQSVLTCQSYIEAVHNTLHLPWWATILICTIGLRTFITFPVAIYQRVIVARLQNVRLQIPELAKELKIETAQAAKMYDWPEHYSRHMYNRSLKKVVKELIEKENCHPFKSILIVLIQMPLWVCVSFALRNMVYMMPVQDMAAQLLFMDLSVGGALWFSNLTLPDASFILPITLGLLNLAIVEVHTLNNVKITRFHRVLTNVMRGTSLFMVLLAANVPSCMALYWTTSSLLGLLQNMTLQSPSFRRICRIPSTPTDIEKPFQEFLKRITKFKFSRN